MGAASLATTAATASSVVFSSGGVSRWLQWPDRPPVRPLGFFFRNIPETVSLERAVTGGEAPSSRQASSGLALHSSSPLGYGARPMRFLLVMWLAIGMAPGLGEVTETVVHLATSGHLAHSDADQGDLGSQGDEHGCGTTQHHCGCCASQVVAAAPRTEVAVTLVLACGQVSMPGTLASLHEPTLPFRPPIAS